jgi:hypothetical protein
LDNTDSKSAFEISLNLSSIPILGRDIIIAFMCFTPCREAARARREAARVRRVNEEIESELRKVIITH